MEPTKGPRDFSEDDFVSITSGDLTFEEVNTWLNQSKESLVSIKNLPKGKVYFNPQAKVFTQSAEWMSKKVEQMKSRDSFVYSFGKTIGDALVKSVDTARMGAESLVRTWARKSWADTSAGFDAILTDLSANLAGVEQLARTESTSLDTLVQLKDKVSQLRTDVSTISVGLNNLKEAYAKDKQTIVAQKTAQFYQDAVREIDNTLRSLNQKIAEMKNQEEEEITLDFVEIPEEISQIVEEKLPPEPTREPVIEESKVEEEIEEKLPSEPPMESVIEESKVKEEIEEKLPSEPPMESVIEESKVKEEEVKKEKTAGIEVQEAKDLDKLLNDFKIAEKEEARPKPTPSISTRTTSLTKPKISPSEQRALAGFKLNEVPLKEVLNNLDAEMFSVILVYVLNIWRKKTVKATFEPTKSFRFAEQIVRNLTINSINFATIVDKLEKNELIRLKNLLVNYSVYMK